MRLEVGSTVELTYTDKTGETRVWQGQVRAVEEERGFFRLKTGEGPRNFRFENVEGEVKVLAAA